MKSCFPSRQFVTMAQVVDKTGSSNLRISFRISSALFTLVSPAMTQTAAAVSRMRTSCSVTLRLSASVSLQENSFCAAGSGAPLPALPVWDKISALPLRLLDLATSKFPPGLE